MPARRAAHGSAPPGRCCGGACGRCHDGPSADRPRPHRDAPHPAAGRAPDRWPIAGRGANALFRAAEAARPAGQRIVDDPYAARFSERHPLVQAIRASRFAVPPVARELARLQVAHCTRHRALDVLVEEALGDGYTQIVTLGAGYDTRPLRLGGGARWFEVDAPETAARKRALLPGRRPPRCGRT
ncbi:MAG: class I SAM-dependent methyltransferase [bacterium]